MEILVRLFLECDSDGNCWFYSRQLRPYRLPVQRVRYLVNSFGGSPDSFIVYDSLLGWTIRPNSTSRDGLDRSNSAGLRSEPREYSLLPESTTLRIAIFGDSYVFGADVPFEETWGYFLEHGLNDVGIKAEVMNFGASGYGIDQAYLRWKCLGKKFSPNVVILGFQPENMFRNVNLIRPIYFARSGIPFQKPRFVLGEGGLDLIGVPTLEPLEIASTLNSWNTYTLRQYENWYDSHYQDHWYLHSKLISLILDELQENRFNQCLVLANRYLSNGEPIRLSIAIVRQFREDVERSGGRFFVADLPRWEDLACALEGGKLPYESVLNLLSDEAGVQMIRPGIQMLSHAHGGSLDRLFKGHYSKFGNRIIADEITNHLRRSLTDGRMASE